MKWLIKHERGSHKQYMNIPHIKRYIAPMFLLWSHIQHFRSVHPLALNGIIIAEPAGDNNQSVWRSRSLRSGLRLSPPPMSQLACDFHSCIWHRVRGNKPDVSQWVSRRADNAVFDRGLTTVSFHAGSSSHLVYCCSHPELCLSCCLCLNVLCFVQFMCF